MRPLGVVLLTLVGNGLALAGNLVARGRTALNPEGRLGLLVGCGLVGVAFALLVTAWAPVLHGRWAVRSRANPVRWRRWAGRAGVLVGVALGWVALIGAPGLAVLLLLPAPPCIDADTFIRIREGMTEEHCVAILGGPPGDYRTRQVAYVQNAVLVQRMKPHIWERRPYTWQTWSGNTGSGTVFFSPQGEVVAKRWERGEPGRLLPSDWPNRLARLRRFLRW